jgi:hypothetical protein
VEEEKDLFQQIASARKKFSNSYASKLELAPLFLPHLKYSRCIYNSEVFAPRTLLTLKTGASMLYTYTVNGRNILNPI